nr:MAG TPA: hypothetical protein [Caudoviricetes sp.]
MILQETYLIIIDAKNISILYYVAIEFLAFSWYNECRQLCNTGYGKGVSDGMTVVNVYSSPTGRGRKRSLPLAGKCYRWSATVASDLSQTSLTFLKKLEFLWRSRIRTLKG